MNKVYQDAIDRANRIRAKMSKDVQLIRSLPELAGASTVHPYEDDVTVYLPFNPDFIVTNCQILAEAGWRNDRVRDCNNGAYLEYWSKDRNYLCLYYSPTDAGSTCNLVQVGTREEPIFERVCE